MNHISKEIELNMNARYTFRNKVTYSLYISPFVLLGAYLYTISNKEKILANSENLETVIGQNFWKIAILIFLFISIGIASAIVEYSITKRNNNLRNLLLELESKEASQIAVTKEPEKIKEPLSKKENILERKEYLFTVYFVFFLLMLGVIFIVFQFIFELTPDQIPIPKH